MKDHDSDPDGGLIDLSGLDLLAVDKLPDTVLAGSLRLILSSAAETADRYSSFESALSCPDLP